MSSTTPNPTSGSTKKSSNTNNSKKGWWASRSPLVKFFALFVILMVIFYFFYYSSFYDNFIKDRLLQSQAKISSVILNIFGFGTTAAGDQIYNDDFVVSIKGGCDGMEATALYICGILAFPLVALKNKWKGLLTGILVLATINIFRIVGLFLSGLYWPSAFEFLHLHGGVVIFTIFAIILWVIWVNRQIKTNA